MTAKQYDNKLPAKVDAVQWTGLTGDPNATSVADLLGWGVPIRMVAPDGGTVRTALEVYSDKDARWVAVADGDYVVTGDNASFTAFPNAVFTANFAEQAAA